MRGGHMRGVSPLSRPSSPKATFQDLRDTRGRGTDLRPQPMWVQDSAIWAMCA